MIINHGGVIALLKCYNAVFNLACMPQVLVIYGDSDNCGMMNIFAPRYGDNIQREVMYLYPDAIEHTANVDGVTPNQMAMETIFHEYIHYFTHISGGDLCAHEGAIWDSMITMGIGARFITRREI